MTSSITLSVSIAAAPRRVYEFASNPANLPLWAPAFCQTITCREGRWLVKSPTGCAVIEFVAGNEWGILDHTVTLESGLRLYNPMRVVANGEGSELLFTLFQRMPRDEAQLREDARLVMGDLRTLKGLLEANGPPPPSN